MTIDSTATLQSRVVDALLSRSRECRGDCRGRYSKRINVSRFSILNCKLLKEMVGTRRLELLTSTVSRWRSNQLSYAPMRYFKSKRKKKLEQPAVDWVTIG